MSVSITGKVSAHLLSWAVREATWLCLHLCVIPTKGVVLVLREEEEAGKGRISEKII